MKSILYTYPILFGRISLKKKNNTPKLKSINELFYEGLGNIISCNKYNSKFENN